MLILMEITVAKQMKNLQMVAHKVKKILEPAMVSTLMNKVLAARIMDLFLVLVQMDVPQDSGSRTCFDDCLYSCKQEQSQCVCA